MSRTTKHASPGSCPSCGYRFEASTATHGRRAPKVGDLTICIGCQVALQYLSLDPLELEVVDLASFPTDIKVEVAHVQAAIRRAREQAGRAR